VTRIVAGTRGGRHLRVPPGRGTRPTSDRVREALFSSLDALTGLDGCRFLDLYAGSGAIGLEAASRGAARVLLVESDPRAVAVVRANVATLELSGVCEVRGAPVAAVLTAGTATGYDVAVLDPPYECPGPEVAGVLTTLVMAGWLAPDAVVVVERSTRSPEPAWPAGLLPERSRRYGETTLWYGRHAGPARIADLPHGPATEGLR
jgi:16S rRNA (guanine966-N2)-methyltransferase